MFVHAIWAVCTIWTTVILYTSILSPALDIIHSLFLSPKCALKCLTNSTPSTCFFQNFTWPSWLPVTIKSVLVCVFVNIVYVCLCSRGSQYQPNTVSHTTTFMCACCFITDLCPTFPAVKWEGLVDFITWVMSERERSVTKRTNCALLFVLSNEWYVFCFTNVLDSSTWIALQALKISSSFGPRLLTLGSHWCYSLDKIFQALPHSTVLQAMEQGSVHVMSCYGIC